MDRRGFKRKPEKEANKMRDSSGILSLVVIIINLGVMGTVFSAAV